MYRYSSNRKAIHEGSEGGQDMNEKSQKRELDLEAMTVDGKPLVLVVDNDEICDDACTTIHTVCSYHDAKVVLWNGFYYTDEDEFAEVYADYHIDGSGEALSWPHEMKKLEAKARGLWDANAIDCVVARTTGMFSLDCEVK